MSKGSANCLTVISPDKLSSGFELVAFEAEAGPCVLRAQARCVFVRVHAVCHKRAKPPE